MTDKAACEAAAAEALKAFGRIDILINNAGITQPVKTLEISGADYDRILDVNLRGTLYMSQAVLPAMREQRSGSIVCISSVSAQRGGGTFSKTVYSAAKAGVIGFTRSVARELGPQGVTVNAISPGPIDTEIMGGRLTDERKASMSAGIPLGRVGQPEEIAATVAFLLSDGGGYMNGSTLQIDGGKHMH